MIKEGFLKEAHLNWALKGARSWNEEIKGQSIPGRRNGLSKGTAMMELTSGKEGAGVAIQRGWREAEDEQLVIVLSQGPCTTHLEYST